MGAREDLAVGQAQVVALVLWQAQHKAGQQLDDIFVGHHQYALSFTQCRIQRVLQEIEHPFAEVGEGFAAMDLVIGSIQGGLVAVDAETTLQTGFVLQGEVAKVPFHYAFVEAQLATRIGAESVQEDAGGLTSAGHGRDIGLVERLAVPGIGRASRLCLAEPGERNVYGPGKTVDFVGSGLSMAY